jgi:hypothetical protein
MHFISLGSANFLAFLFLKDNIKKLKKQAKRIRIFIKEKQLTDELQLLLLSDRFKEEGRPSKHSGAATAFGD